MRARAPPWDASSLLRTPFHATPLPLAAGRVVVGAAAAARGRYGSGGATMGVSARQARLASTSPQPPRSVLTRLPRALDAGPRCLRPCTHWP